MAEKETTESKRRRVEGVVADLLKRAVELGVEKATEAPENIKELVGGIKVPKEIASYLLAQVDETKNGLFRVVAKEMRDFLEHTNFAGEVQKVLTTVQFEIATTIRFRPNDGSSAQPAGETSDSEPPAEDSSGRIGRPEVTTDVTVRRDEPRRERRRSRE